MAMIVSPYRETVAAGRARVDPLKLMGSRTFSLISARLLDFNKISADLTNGQAGNLHSRCDRVWNIPAVVGTFEIRPSASGNCTHRAAGWSGIGLCFLDTPVAS